MKQEHGIVFDYPWLGYTEDIQETFRLIKDTGYFYIFICFSFLFCFLFLYNKSSAIREVKKTHLVFIMLWGIAGFMLINNIFVIFCTFIISIFAFRSLFIILCISDILGTIIIPLPSLNLALKNHRFFQELQKRKLTPDIFVSCSQLNEFILWAFIFYRSLITLRAGLTLHL